MALLCQNPISGRAGSPLHAGRFWAYGWRRVPHMRDAPYLALCFCNVLQLHENQQVQGDLFPRWNPVLRNSQISPKPTSRDLLHGEQ